MYAMVMARLSFHDKGTLHELLQERMEPPVQFYAPLWAAIQFTDVDLWPQKRFACTWFLLCTHGQRPEKCRKRNRTVTINFFVHVKQQNMHKSWPNKGTQWPEIRRMAGCLETKTGLWYQDREQSTHQGLFDYCLPIHLPICPYRVPVNITL